jgi:hypothetical protein
MSKQESQAKIPVRALLMRGNGVGATDHRMTFASRAPTYFPNLQQKTKFGTQNSLLASYWN